MEEELTFEGTGQQDTAPEQAPVETPVDSAQNQAGEVAGAPAIADGTQPQSPQATAPQTAGEQYAADMRREIEAFAKAYPGVTELPDAVLADIAQNGSTPIEAYQRHIIAALNVEIQALKKLTTPGSVKSAGGLITDEFLSNFN